MSDDDTGSIITNPFDRDIITDEVLAENERPYWENLHPAGRGPPFRSLVPPPRAQCNVTGQRQALAGKHTGCCFQRIG